MFIKRRNNQARRVGASNLMESKSLTNLTSLSDTASITKNMSSVSLSSSSQGGSSDSQQIYVPKTLSSNSLSHDLTSETFDTPKSVSKSTDMLISDLKTELQQLRMKKAATITWNKDYPLKREISKHQVVKPSGQNIY